MLMAPHTLVKKARRPLPISPVENIISSRMVLSPDRRPLPSLLMYAQSLAICCCAILAVLERSLPVELMDPPPTALAIVLVRPENSSVSSWTDILITVERMKMMVVPTRRRMATRSTRKRIAFAGQDCSNWVLNACRLSSSLVKGHAVGLTPR